MQLNKDEEEILKVGDCIGLLPDDYWFQIKTKEKQNNKEVESVQLSIIDHKSGIEKLNDYRLNSESSFKNENDTKLNMCENSDTLPSLNNISFDKNKSDVINIKEMSRSNRLGSPDFEKTRKLPLHMYDIDHPCSSLPSLSQNSNCIQPEEHVKKKIKIEPSNVNLLSIVICLLKCNVLNN